MDTSNNFNNNSSNVFNHTRNHRPIQSNENTNITNIDTVNNLKANTSPTNKVLT